MSEKANVPLEKIRSLVAKRRYRDARAAISEMAVSVHQSDLRGKPKYSVDVAVSLLLKYGFYQEATWLIGSLEKYTGLSVAANFGNPLHTSLYATNAKDVQRWDPFFSTTHDVDEIVRMVFRNSIPVEHSAQLEEWRKTTEQPKVLTFGSCFARELANGMADLGLTAETLHLEESINTPRAIVEVLTALTVGGTNEFIKSKLAGRESLLKDLLRNSNMIVITIGVGFYYVTKDGDYYIGENYAQKIRSGEISAFFPDVAEQIDHICQISSILRTENQNAKLLITLSPVPISGFIGDPGMFVADCVSKSSLRTAIFQALPETDFIYLPTFEVVKWISPHFPSDIGMDTFSDPRHPNNEIVKCILKNVLPTAKDFRQ